MKQTIYIIGLLLLFGISACTDCEKLTQKPCGDGLPPLLDMIIIMDQSSSMNNEAIAVSEAAESAVKVASNRCPQNLRVTYFGVEGVSWPQTVFNQNHIKYLNSIHPNTSLDLAANVNPGQRREQGADAVTDLSRYFDWRPNACRAIFYISDEPLDGNTDILTENMAVDNAIQSANMNGVKVYCHAIMEGAMKQENIDNYDRLCNETGGQNYLDENVDASTYKEILPIIICDSCKPCSLNDFTK